jgi:hypothetical protein
VENGALKEIKIIDGGSGYKSTPTVEIDPPVRTLPTVSSSVDRIAISRTTDPGHLYRFESSVDLQNWIAVSAPIVAQSDLMTLDVAVSDEKRFYRLTELK